MSTQDQFNISAEKSIANRISSYDLTSEEKAEIWKQVQQRDLAIDNENKSFRENYAERFNSEAQEIRANQAPENNFDHPSDRRNMTEEQIRILADRQVKSKHFAITNTLHHKLENYIDSVLDKAMDEGRGPNMEHSYNMNQYNDNVNNLDQNQDPNKWTLGVFDPEKHCEQSQISHKYGLHHNLGYDYFLQDVLAP